MKHNEYKSRSDDFGEDAYIPSPIVEKMKMYGKDLLWLAAIGTVMAPSYLFMGLGNGSNWLYAFLDSTIRDMKTNLSWRRGQTDSESGSEASDRQSVDDSDAGDGRGSEVPQDRIKGEGESDQLDEPEESEELSTPEIHCEDGDADEIPT